MPASNCSNLAKLRALTLTKSGEQGQISQFGGRFSPEWLPSICYLVSKLVMSFWKGGCCISCEILIQPNYFKLISFNFINDALSSCWKKTLPSGSCAVFFRTEIFPLSWRWPLQRNCPNVFMSVWDRNLGPRKVPVFKYKKSLLFCLVLALLLVVFLQHIEESSWPWQRDQVDEP